MTIITQAVARVAAATVRSLFDPAEPQKQMARVAGLNREEVQAAVEELSPWAADRVRLIVITPHPWPGLDPRFALAPGKSATDYRNFKEHCLFFEVEEFSDAQGLRNLPCLTDGDLAGAGRSEVDAALGAFEETWRLRHPDRSVPTTVLQVTRELLQLCGQHEKRVGLRPWVRFADAVSSRLLETPAVDQSSAREAIGIALPELDLFPDSLLRGFDGEVPRRRRLGENILAAMDRMRSGKEIDRDELAATLDSIHFEGLDGKALGETEVTALRDRIRNYLVAFRRTRPDGIELTHWKQLFEFTKQRKGIGTRILEELSVAHPDRVGEYDELDVQVRLDIKDVEAAQTFLDHDAGDGQPRLADVISSGLRSAVSRIANPKAQATDRPLTHLVRLLHDEMEEEAGTGGALCFEVRRRHGASAESDVLSRALFALLYGPTLSEVADRSSAFSTSLRVDPQLTDPGALSGWIRAANAARADDGDEEDVEGEGWEPLRLQLRWSDEGGGTQFFEWRPRDMPGFAVLAALMLNPSGWRWQSGSDFDSWCSEWLEDGAASGSAWVDPPQSPIVVEWVEQRRGVLSAMGQSGLNASTLSPYVAVWERLLQRAYAELVPDGISLPEIKEFLSVDTCVDPAGVPCLLATHPLRLRWIAAYLEACRDHLLALLAGEIELNPTNHELFFDRLYALSPHEQPPLLCDDSRAYVAVREMDWHERFEVVRTAAQTRTDWLADLDDSSLDELAEALGDYVEAHPYAADGLAVLLVVREGGARTIRRLLGQFFAQRGLLGRRTASLMTLHLVCPSGEIPAVADALSLLDDPSERASRDFPRVRAVFHDWGPHADLPTVPALSQPIDVAIVPNLFSASTRCQEGTQDIDQRKGAFHPLWDRPITREAGATGPAAKNVSRILIPETRDETLSMWSTINVRHFRGTPVGARDSTSVDFLSLRLAVAPGEAFFEAVHRVANWVITLDAFIGREQIEALDHSPQVISVKAGLGKGAAYTRVTSSNSGREFVVSRLERRLIQQLGDRLGVPARGVADAIFDHAKELAPTTLLRAMGLGRVAQELVGLVVSRHLTLEFSPPRLVTNGFEAWIALDEWPQWFLGGAASRADLLRVVGRHDDTGLSLELTVVEAKLRTQATLSHAEEQVRRTVSQFEAALSPAGSTLTDGAIWRRALLEALQEAARPPRHGHAVVFRSRWGGVESYELPAEIRAAIRDGRYELSTFSGVVCTIGDVAAPLARTASGYLKIRVSLDEVATALRNLSATDGMLSGSVGAAPAAALPTETLISADNSPAPEPPLPTLVLPTQPSRDRRGMGSAALAKKYQTVLDAFAEFGVEVRQDDVNPVQEGPGFIVYRVRPGPGVTPATVKSKVEIIQLRLNLPAGFQPRSYIDQGAVVFEVPKTDDERYYVRAADLWSRHVAPADALEVPIGEDISGELVTINFSSSDTPHLLVGGITGAGKSVVLETILTGLTRSYPPGSLRLSLVDPKGTELSFLENDAHVDGPIGFGADEATAALESMVEEMQRRYALMKTRHARNLLEYNQKGPADQTLPWRLVVLDEFADLTSDKDDKRKIEQLLQRLAQKARGCGIHVIVATQKPSAEVISTTIRSNLGAQLALRVKTASDSRIIMDDAGAEALAGRGDAFLKTSGGQLVRLQCAQV